MPFRDPPPHAAWQHRGARDGFEVVFLVSGHSGWHAEGATSAVEADDAWSVRYAIELNADSATLSAAVNGRSASGRHHLELRADAGGRWHVDGRPAEHLDGCLDVDLESSCLTNAFPVHRLALEIGQVADAPAAYVRAVDLRVERLEQRYSRLDDEGGRQRYSYAAPAFDFVCELVYDESGLLLDYPGIGTRAA